MYMLAMSPQTKSGCWMKSSGPGCRPSMSRAPSMMAVVPLPGIPRHSRWIRDPPAAALLADSGPATPSIAPLPSSSLCLLTFFSRPYETKLATAAPAPAMPPTKNPESVPRMKDGMNALPILLRQPQTALDAQSILHAPFRSARLTEHLAQGEQADRHRQKLEAVHHLRIAEGVAGHAALMSMPMVAIARPNRVASRP